jgi:hypothetical protein
MAAAVSPASTLCLVSGATGLSGNLALVEGIGALGELGAGAGVDGCAAGPIKAAGCANADGEVGLAATGALLIGAFWRPTE